jgi:hypothetical protein
LSGGAAAHDGKALLCDRWATHAQGLSRQQAALAMAVVAAEQPAAVLELSACATVLGGYARFDTRAPSPFPLDDALLRFIQEHGGAPDGPNAECVLRHGDQVEVVAFDCQALSSMASYAGAAGPLQLDAHMAEGGPYRGEAERGVLLRTHERTPLIIRNRSRQRTPPHGGDVFCRFRPG